MSCFEQSSFANGFPMNWAILGGGQLGTEMRGRNNSDHSVISMVLSLPFKSFGPMLSDHLQGVLGWPCGDTEHDHAVLTHLSTVRKRLLDRRYRALWADLFGGSVYFRPVAFANLAPFRCPLRPWIGVPASRNSAETFSFSKRCSPHRIHQEKNAITNSLRLPQFVQMVICSLSWRMFNGETMVWYPMVPVFDKCSQICGSMCKPSC